MCCHRIITGFLLQINQSKRGRELEKSFVSAGDDTGSVSEEMMFSGRVEESRNEQRSKKKEKLEI